MLKKIAIIPARSGSKGVRDKNIRKLDGKPLMNYSIEAAQKSGIFDVIHVSTDSEIYAHIARDCGADVPFLRAESVALDNSSTWDAVRYVLDKYREIGKAFDIVVVLQPTSPLRDENDIVNAWGYFQSKKANMVSSVCLAGHSPLLYNILPEDMSMENFEDEKLAYLPRQSLPIYYRENGAIYIVRTECLFKKDNLYKNKCYAYVMERSHSIDIDDEMDFAIAEFLRIRK